MTNPYNLLPRVGSSMAEEWLDIGLQHHVVGRYPQAQESYIKGLRCDPNCGPIINNLGVMAAQQGQMLTAVQHFERATLFDDKNATIWYNLALAYLEAERQGEAVPAIERSLELVESASAYCAKGMILTSCGYAAEAVVAYDKALAKEPTHPMASYNAIFARTLTETSPAANNAARKRWYDAFAYKGEKKPHDNDRTPDRPLRVGYVGGDFKMHSAAFIFGMIILNHDRKAVDPYCYMTMVSDPEKDLSTKNFMQRTNWRDVSTVIDDAALDEIIRKDKIDILVDLSGHTGGNRLPMFTRKPAPVQVHAWGFAHGSGCPEIDYFFADPYAVPAAEREHFAEKIWDLPAIVGYDPPGYNQPVAPIAPVSRDGIFRFGVFGRFEKMSPASLEAWRRILLAVPNSQIYFKDLMMRRTYPIKRIREIMKDVDPSRLLFMQDTSHPEQMLAYQSVDLALDTFPHSGGVTALEMLYMGVPIITLYNTQVGGRTPAVVLRTIGRQDWIADSVNDYVRKAVNLAQNRVELSKARATLRDEMLKSDLCGVQYVRAVETAYRQMWWRYCGHDADHSRDTGVAGAA